MSLQLLPAEREALSKALTVVERIYGYCRVMLDRGAPLDDIDAIVAMHAATAGLSVELAEMIATFDGTLESSQLIAARRRLLIDAEQIVQRIEGGNSVTAARLRVLSEVLSGDK